MMRHGSIDSPSLKNSWVGEPLSPAKLGPKKLLEPLSPIRTAELRTAEPNSPGARFSPQKLGDSSPIKLADICELKSPKRLGELRTRNKPMINVKMFTSTNPSSMY